MTSTKEFQNFQLETRIRVIVREVLQGFNDKIIQINTQLAKLSDETSHLSNRAQALQHKSEYFDAKFEFMQRLVRQSCSKQKGISERCAFQAESCNNELKRLKVQELNRFDKIEYIRNELQLNQSKFKEIYKSLHIIKAEGQDKIGKYISESIKVNAQLKMDFQVLSHNYLATVQSQSELRKLMDQNIKNYELFVHQKEFFKKQASQLIENLKLKADREQAKLFSSRAERQSERRIHQLEAKIRTLLDEKYVKSNVLSAWRSLNQQQQASNVLQIKALADKLSQVSKENSDRLDILDQGKGYLQQLIRNNEAHIQNIESESKDREEAASGRMNKQLSQLQSLIIFTKSDLIARMQQKLSKLNEVIFSEEGDKQSELKKLKLRLEQLSKKFQ